MKKKLISTLILLSAINITIPARAIDVIESAVQPEPSGAPVVEEKISVWSKFKERTINFFKKDSETAEDKIENGTVAEIEDKTQTTVEKQKKTSLETLFDEPDRALIMGLIMLLKSEGADESLIMALTYILS